MMINPLSPNLVHLFDTGFLSKNSGILNESSGFANIMSESLRTANQTDEADKASSLQILMGETDDLSGALLDAQKAELSLQLALQIRNKIIDAYNEVMRMSV